jgi:hypothetical protein
MKFLKIGWVAALVMAAVFAGSTAATAANITIADKMGTGTGWYGAQEDQEVEANCLTGQAWDLEAFIQTGKTLSIVGGYNFKDGYAGTTTGDLFLATAGITPAYGGSGSGSNGSTPVLNGYGYNYAVRMDFGAGSYTVYKIDAADWVLKAYYAQNAGSNPWKYSSGGTAVGTGTLGFSNRGTADYLGQTGGTHYEVVFDGLLALLDFASPDFYAHYTMSCGNDDLMGKGTVPVPEPGTMLLLGCGLVALAVIGRRSVRE